MMIALLLAAISPLGSSDNIAAIPVDRKVLKAEDFAFPVGESVRAVTWEQLDPKPGEPVLVPVACIIAAGAPGSCVPSSLIDSTSKTVNWPAALDKYDQWIRTATATEVAAIRTVTKRLQAARLIYKPSSKLEFSIRLFAETVSPDDARPRFAQQQEPLTMRGIKLASPIDTAIINRLYPISAMRNSEAARVVINCDIQTNLKLLCLDKGTVEFLSANPPSDVDAFTEAFRFATYQFASTLQLLPTDLEGKQVVGRQLRIGLTWLIPQL